MDLKTTTTIHLVAVDYMTDTFGPVVIESYIKKKSSVSKVNNELEEKTIYFPYLQKKISS